MSRESMIHERSQLEAIEDVHSAVSKMRPTGITLEEALHPIQAFWVLPVFALFNAGVPLGEGLVERLQSPVSLGILLGLVVGKPAGVMLCSWLAVRSGRAALPSGINWGQIFGAGMLAGIGFTMSLFISELAFTEEAVVSSAKIGILTASFIAGICGFLILQRSLPARTDSEKSR